jgi:hypothetical protein
VGVGIDEGGLRETNLGGLGHPGGGLSGIAGRCVGAGNSGHGKRRLKLQFRGVLKGGGGGRIVLEAVQGRGEAEPGAAVGGVLVGNSFERASGAGPVLLVEERVGFGSRSLAE